MPRLQSLAPLLRPLAAPRTLTCRQHFRFSTATQFQAEQPSSNPPNPEKSPAKPSLPPNASPAAPPNAQEAQRAADLAAAEAATEGDSAQPPEPKPPLPSQRSKRSKSTPTKDANSAPSHPQKAQRAADLAAAEAVTEADSAQPPEQKPTVPPKRSQAPTPKPAKPIAPSPPRSAFQTNKFKPETRTQREHRLKNALKAPTPTGATQISLPPPKYHVSRISASQNLPIYTDYKRGGNLRLTMVRKITGDLSALRDELRVLLNKKNEDVKINSLTGQVVVKGHHDFEIRGFLTARGM